MTAAELIRALTEECATAGRDPRDVDVTVYLDQARYDGGALARPATTVRVRAGEILIEGEW